MTKLRAKYQDELSHHWWSRVVLFRSPVIEVATLPAVCTRPDSDSSSFVLMQAKFASGDPEAHYACEIAIDSSAPSQA